MPSELPLLSVIVPVFNGAVTLADALASILAQEGVALEIIVIDDGSTDTSAAIAHSFGDTVVCVSQPNQGPAAARNVGLQIARGELISFLDADDRWPVGRVRHHVDILSQAPEIELVIGATQIVAPVTASGAPVVPRLPAPMLQHHLGAATMRRRVFERVGLFNPALRIGEDKEWFQRALAANIAPYLVSTIALEYRVRSGSLTYGMIDHGHWFLAALRDHLHRRRSAMPENQPS